MILVYIILGLFVLLWIVPNFLLTSKQKDDVKKEMKKKYPNGACKPRAVCLGMYNPRYNTL